MTAQDAVPKPAAVRAAWLTDLHLDFVSPERRDVLGDAILASEANVLLLGGDLATAPLLVEQLVWLDELVARPIYFVLGNHDYYESSIAQVRAATAQLCQQRPRLRYLSTSEPVELAPGVGLVGHDGWGDARAGDFIASDVTLSDYLLIDELRGIDRADLQTRLQQLGDEAAAHLRRVLPAALETWPEVVVLTHVPPLRAACWHAGQTSDDNWAPHFTCQAVGDVLLETLAANLNRRATVLCGHTHSPGVCHPLPNLTIHTGEAEYREPRIQRVLSFPLAETDA